MSEFNDKMIAIAKLDRKWREDDHLNIKGESMTTTTRTLGPCLACGKPIMATIEITIEELTIGNVDLDGTVGTANVKVVGLSVSHDCRKKMAR